MGSHAHNMLTPFIDLIRHGKHHTPATPAASSPTSKHHGASPPEPKEEHYTPAVTPDEAAELIVEEEREASEKMPSYPGLENFKIITKMGE